MAFKPLAETKERIKERLGRMAVARAQKRFYRELQESIREFSGWIAEDIRNFRNGNHAMLKAVAQGDGDKLQRAFKRGADVRYRDNQCLKDAAQRGFADLIDIILTHDPIDNDVRESALRIAVDGGHAEAVRVLLEHGVVFFAPSEHVLWAASKEGHLSIVQMLLDHGADPAAEACRALGGASGGGHLSIVQLLLERGASPTVEALELAIKGGHEDIVRHLLERKANLLNEKKPGSMIRCLAENGNAGILRLLMAYGLGIGAEHAPFLEKAIKNEHHEVAALMISAVVFAPFHPYFSDYRTKLRLKAMNVESLSPGERQDALVCQGEATLTGRLITAAGLLGEIFTPGLWQTEAEKRQARDLHAALLEALPEYRHKIEMVDMTFLRAATTEQNNFLAREHQRSSLPGVRR